VMRTTHPIVEAFDDWVNVRRGLGLGASRIVNIEVWLEVLHKPLSWGTIVSI